MKPICPHCRSSRVVRDGTYERSIRCLRNGCVVQLPSSSTRISCKDCGRTASIISDTDRAEGVAVREHVVGIALAKGRNAAARETSVSRSTVSAYLDEWSQPRESDPARAAPDFLLVEAVRVGGRDRSLLVDVDRETLVEMLDDGGKIADWAGVPGRLHPIRACLGVDPAIAAVARSAMPDTRLMVAPAAVARAVKTRALVALRTLRARSLGSNGFPRAEEFLRGVATTVGEGWPLVACALANTVRSALSVLGARDRQEADRLWPEFAIASSGTESRSILTLMTTWREEILEGIEHRFVDGIWKKTQAVRRALSARRPILSFADLRRLALLRDFRMVPQADLLSWQVGQAIAHGRDLADLPAALA